MDSPVFIRIKELCTEKGITITKLESLMGMSQSTIGKWRTATPTVDKLMKVAQYFQVSLDYLTGLSNERATAENIMTDTRLQSIIALWGELSEPNKNIIEATMMMHTNHDPLDSKFRQRLAYLITAGEQEG